MKYDKPPLSYESQADLLLGRGLEADRDELIDILRRVNYYRLSGYLYEFRRDNDTYGDGATLETIWRRYTFDRRLRLVVMDAIERIEVAVRTSLIYEHVHENGPFAYEDAEYLPKLSPSEHSQWTPLSARFCDGLRLSMCVPAKYVFSR